MYSSAGRGPGIFTPQLFAAERLYQLLGYEVMCFCHLSALHSKCLWSAREQEPSGAVRLQARAGHRLQCPCDSAARTSARANAGPVPGTLLRLTPDLVCRSIGCRLLKILMTPAAVTPLPCPLRCCGAAVGARHLPLPHIEL